MPTIRGPIKFTKVGLPEKLKNWIHENGVTMSMDPATLSYSNEDLDPWLTMRKKGSRTLYRMNRPSGRTAEFIPDVRREEGELGAM